LEAVKAEIAKEGLEQHVEFLGQADRQKLKTQLSLASVLLLPSLQENAPMAISEAMAAGVPVITSNRCGMPYMVEDNRSGFLIEPDDVAQIADRLNRLLGSAELRRSMAARGRKIAMARFHPSEVAQKTLRVYQSLGEQPSPVRSSVAAPQLGA
jgi:glycosyltransferase involved in cell wall biosynthesis